MDGMLLELGPFRPGPNNDLVYNPYTWALDAHILFSNGQFASTSFLKGLISFTVDQPVGTGYSYSLNTSYYAKDEYDVCILHRKYNGSSQCFEVGRAVPHRAAR